MILLKSRRRMETENELKFKPVSEKQIVFLSQLLQSSQLRGLSRNKLLKAIAENNHSMKRYSIIISYVLSLIRFKEEFYPKKSKKVNETAEAKADLARKYPEDSAVRVAQNE